ncbi:hypothetical protein EYZ11_010102 [Aspergillus tanneri]|nr:hypothetical protein EYZ11_010102 [Aspergillus tanneri]
MPRDLATLEKLGLRDIPRWFREKYGIPSLLPSGHGHPRAHGSHGQHWKDDTVDRGGVKSIQYPPQLELNGVVDASDAEKNAKQKSPSYAPSQQHSMGLPGPSRSAFPGGSSPKVSINQRHGHGPKHGPNQHSSIAKRIDLLSFDPLPEYPSLNAVGGGSIGGLNYPTSREDVTVDNADRAQHEFVRNIQSLMPTSAAAHTEYLPGPFEPASAGQNRPKKMQKSRRLYQPRSQVSEPEASFDSTELDSFKSIQDPATASSSVASPTSKDTAGSQLASPVAGPTQAGASEPPTRGASPSGHSGSSSLDSECSPLVLRAQVNENEYRSIPSPIGSKRVHRKKSVGTSNVDFFKLTIGHGK